MTDQQKTTTVAEKAIVNSKTNSNKASYQHFFKVLLLFLGFPVTFFYLNYKIGKEQVQAIQDAIQIRHDSFEKMDSFAFFYEKEKEWLAKYPNYKKADREIVEQKAKKIEIEIIPNKRYTKALVYQNPKSKAWVILCHGWTGNKYEMLHLVNMYYSMGYNVLTFDQRGHGEATPAFCTLGYRESQDLNNITYFVLEKYNPEKIIFHAESMGCMALVRYLKVIDHNLKNKNVILAAILDGAPANLKAQLRGYIKNIEHLPSCFYMFGVDFIYRTYNTLINKVKATHNILETWRYPFLIIHGTDDTLVEPSMAYQIYKAKSQSDPNDCSELFMVEGGKHVESFQVDPVTFKQKISVFLKRCEKSQAINMKRIADFVAKNKADKAAYEVKEKELKAKIKAKKEAKKAKKQAKNKS